MMQKQAQRPVAVRQSTVIVSARHVHRCKTSHIKRRVKKRDIRTSFITGPGVPISRTLTSSTLSVPLPPGWGPQQLVTPTVAAPVVPQPAAAAAPTSAAVDTLALPAAVSLGEPCASDRVVSGPVVALAAAADAEVRAAEAEPVATWVAEDSLPPLPSLAALDSILDGLIVAAPAAVPASTNSSSSSTASTVRPSSKSGSSSSRRGKKSSSTAAAATPAVVSIQCEVDLARELAAATAYEQLVVVKVESGRNQLLRHSADPTLRFQTHSNLPTSLNTYLSHSDNSSFSSYTNSSSTLSSLGINLGSSLNATQPLALGSAAAGGFHSPLDSAYARSALQTGSGLENLASLGLYGLSPSSAGSVINGSSSLGNPTKLDSPVHHWYLDLAAQYVAGSSSKGLACSPLRFLSLQSDSPRAKALCRKLGVSEGLSVLIVEPSSGWKMLEVCGTKIEQDLPSGLLYYSDVDPAGHHPSDVLKPITSKAQLEQVRSSSEVSVVAFHMHAAPPCIKTYGALYQAARTHCNSGVSFAVMDIDSTQEHSELAAELDLQRLPTYAVYKGGREVVRLVRTSERKRLGEVLQGVVAEPALAVAAA